LSVNQVAAIHSTADFHSKLKRIFNKDREELSSEQLKICNDFRSNNETLDVQNINQENETWNKEITVSELKEVKKVAKGYIDKVTPLLNEIEN